MSRREFRYRDGTSYKFWAITVEGKGFSRRLLSCGIRIGWRTKPVQSKKDVGVRQAGVGGSKRRVKADRFLKAMNALNQCLFDPLVPEIAAF